MNKLFTKVAALTLGVAMAAGVGVALGSAKASEAKADSVNFSASNIEGMSSSAGKQSGTYEGFSFVVSNGLLAGTGELRVYKSQTLTVSSTLGNITNFTFTVKSGDQSSNGADGFTGTGYDSSSKATGTWTGNASSFTLTASGHQVRLDSISITYTPSVEPGIFLEPSSLLLVDSGVSKDVTVTTKNFSADPVISLATTPTHVDVELSAGKATFTPKSVGDEKVRINAVNGTESAYAEIDVSVKDKHGRLQNDPFTVAEAKSAIDGGITAEDKVYVTGIISQIDTAASDFSGQIIYWISADGTTSDQLEIYWGRGLDNKNFEKLTDIELGASVVNYGSLKKHNTTYEFDSGSYLVSYQAPTGPALTSVEIGGTATATAGKAWNYDGVTVVAHYEDGSSKDIKDLCTIVIEESPVESMTNATVKVTYKDEVYTETISVSVSPAPAAKDFQKITSTNELADGKYLIVFEDSDSETPASLTFDSTLEKLDAASNTVGVTVEDSKINISEDEAFEIKEGADGYTIKSSSGYYIGQTSDANGLQASETVEYKNSITFDDTGSANISSSGAFLRYNSTSGQTRFRYYKSSSYTNQKPIALYKVYEAPQPATYEVSFYEGNTGGGTQYAEGAKVTIPQPTESLIPEGKEFDYWEHKETGDHYAPGDEFTVGTSSARFDAVYKDAAATDWSDAQKEDFTAQLDGYVPPFFGELVGDLNVGQNSIYFTVSGDITADFATKLGSDWTAEDDGSYTLETLNGSIMAYASLDGSNTYVIFQFNAAPVQTDWSDTFKATWNERFVNGDSQIAALPPFLGAELSSDANVSWHTSYPYADIDVVDGTDLAIFNAIDDALYNSADRQYVGKLEQGVGYVYVEKTLTAYAVVYAYQATKTEIHSGVTFEVVGSISADTTNAKLEYFVGDTIDISGVVVHFALLDGTWIHSAPFVVPIDYCTPDVTTFDAAGTVTVTLDVAGVYTVKYQVTVTAVALTSLEVSGTPSVTEYKVGEEWNPEGLVVTATYNNGTTADVTNQVTWTFDPSETAKEVESVSVTASLGDVTSAPFAYAVSVSDGYDANQFARDLLDAVAPICANYDGKTNNKLALRTVWETMSQRYASLSGEEKAKVIEASAKVDGTDLEKAMAFYNYACKKYGLTKFIEGRQVNALVSTHETSSSILPIIVIVASSIAAVTAIGVVIGLKRRKSFITK